MASWFALVRFLMDNVKDIVPISYIKNFKPKSLTDFEPGKVYLVKWEDAGHPGEEDYYKGNILILDDSKEKVQERSQSSRLKLPKVIDTSVEENSSSEEEAEKAQEMVTKEKKQKTKEKDISRQSSLRAILSESLSKKQQNPLFHEGSQNPRSCSECKELQKSVATQKRSLDELQLKVKRLKQDREEYVASLGQYKKLNQRLQAKLLEFLEQPGSSKKSPTVVSVALDKQKAVEQKVSPAKAKDGTKITDGESETKLYSEQDGKVFLGGDIWLTTAKWHAVDSQKRHSIFVKSLLTAVWGTDNLKDRSIGGKVCPRFSGERDAKRPLSPAKLKIVKECFIHRLRQRGLSTEAVMYEDLRFNKYVSEKLQDIARKPKNPTPKE
ncbi:BEN domain-containing protein 5 [Holothuria leucospilota]|uniref:BEN domain-containing protein 5 n=1 Tax=Holothuria leucospilota TaxID=206669 RepID=A0A9Q0YCZ4_HOLLE|nr:BEN domain-containing protein 5 [Holothuria leucospilota]